MSPAFKAWEYWFLSIWASFFLALFWTVLLKARWWDGLLLMAGLILIRVGYTMYIWDNGRKTPWL